MQRFRILASISIVAIALTSCTCARAQESNKDKQQDHARRADKNSQQKPGDSGRILGHQKEMLRTPEQEQTQQVAQREAWQQRRANHWQYEHRTWQQRGGYHGVMIQDDYFRDHFGKEHTFRMYDLPFVYENGNPRFQFEGYWFTMLDPYPENWSGYWYRNDDLYVDIIDGGYYLFNRGFPSQPGIAIDVTL